MVAAHAGILLLLALKELPLLPSFTFFLNFWWCVARALRWEAFEDVMRCCAWGAAASFGAAPLLDRTCYARMARTRGMRAPAFHAANLLVHAGPLALTRAHGASVGRGVAAVAVHCIWGFSVTDGTMRLDDVYVPMRPGHWQLLWLVAFVAEVAAGLA